MAQEVVIRLECARDRRNLAPHEEELRQGLKLKSLGLASLQRTIARHESRLLWLSDRDMPTCFSMFTPTPSGGTISFIL
jgi:hypothetical protein